VSISLERKIERRKEKKAKKERDDKIEKKGRFDC